MNYTKKNVYVNERGRLAIIENIQTRSSTNMLWIL